jgi:hypothetical protein
MLVAADKLAAVRVALLVAVEEQEVLGRMQRAVLVEMLEFLVDQVYQILFLEALLYIHKVVLAQRIVQASLVLLHQPQDLVVVEEMAQVILLEDLGLTA